MASELLQHAIVTGTAVIAAAGIVRRLVQAVKPRARAGACGACASSACASPPNAQPTEPASQPMVLLRPQKKKA